MFACASDPASRDSRRNRDDHGGVRAVERAQLLERDEPVKVKLAREVHHGHAASSEFLEDLVAIDVTRTTHPL